MPYTKTIPAFDLGTTGCFYCTMIWTRAIDTRLDFGSLYECDHCGKEYMMVNEDNFYGWQPTVTVIRAGSKKGKNERPTRRNAGKVTPGV